jgi:predicted fused transcriptional regulator/phosphomethylpyrimidine kinase
MKKPVSFLLFFLCLSLSEIIGQPKSPVLFQVRTSPDAKEINIPGTKVNITPPTDFQLSKQFTGLQGGSSVIEVYDLPGGSYRTISDDFTMEKFRAQGLTVFSVDDVSVDGYDGRIISLQNEPGQKGFSLVFGDDSFSVIVVSNFKAQDLPLENAIRQSLLNIRYDKHIVSDDMSFAVFRLDDVRSPFRYDKRSANTFYYIPRIASEVKDSYLTVSQLAWDYTTTPSTIGELMVTEMKKYGLENTDVRKKSTRKINGYHAFESEIYATRNGEACMVYQVVLVHDSKALVIHGIGSSDLRKNRDEFKKLAYSVQFK